MIETEIVEKLNEKMSNIVKDQQETDGANSDKED